jgi:hypothetical protein
MLEMVYDQLMHEFNVLEDSGHSSINGMIEKCAALALQFHREMDAEDEIDDDEIEDGALENESALDQDAPPQTPGMPPTMVQGTQGVMMEVSRVRLDHLPWCNGLVMTTEPTKMRLPRIKNLYFYCFIASL